MPMNKSNIIIIIINLFSLHNIKTIFKQKRKENEGIKAT